jgi:hypothetical protein
VIKLKDAGICTCNQWNKDNIRTFIEVANSLKMKIEDASTSIGINHSI